MPPISQYRPVVSEFAPALLFRQVVRNRPNSRRVGLRAATRGTTHACVPNHSLDKQLFLWLLLGLNRQQGGDIVAAQELISASGGLGWRRRGRTTGHSRSIWQRWPDASCVQRMNRPLWLIIVKCLSRQRARVWRSVRRQTDTIRIRWLNEETTLC